MRENKILYNIRRNINKAECELIALRKLKRKINKDYNKCINDISDKEIVIK